MARPAKPFFHRGWWVTDLGGQRAGIAPDQNGEQVVMYTARHTYATSAVASGVTDRRLADLMGHTNTKTTQRYIHLATDDLYSASQEATRGYISPK